MNTKYYVLLGAFSIAGFFTPAQAQINEAALQRALSGALATTEASGAAAAIVRRGEVLWSGQAGVIAPGSATPVGPDTLFAYGSVGKMATATMTLHLVEQGRIGLDTSIAHYLPAGIPGADTITVRQLLNHTSGYGEVLANPSVVDRLLDMDHPWTRAELIAEVVSPTTAPGVAYEYSNTNYILLGEVIERASGKSFAEVYQETIAAPLGLAHAFVTPRPREEFAQGVAGMGADAVNYFDLTSGVPSALYGGIFADSPVAGNAADGARFLDGLLHGELLQAETLAAMQAFDPVSGYGLGLYGGEINGRTMIGHNGSWGGFTAFAFYDQESDLTFMTVANSEADYSAGVIFGAVTAAANSPAAAVPEPTTTALAAGALLSLLCLLRHRGRDRHNTTRKSVPARLTT